MRIRVISGAFYKRPTTVLQLLDKYFRWVVTAAHCISTFDNTNFTFVQDAIVRVGEHDLSSTTETTLTKDFGVESVVVHPGDLGVPVDLALINVRTEIDIMVYTPLCLPASGK